MANSFASTNNYFIIAWRHLTSLNVFKNISLSFLHKCIACSPPWDISKENLMVESKSADVFIMFPGSCCCCCCCWLIIRLLFGLLLLLVLASTNALFDPMESSGLVRFRRMLLFALFVLAVFTTLVCCVRPLTTALSPCRMTWDEFRPLFGPPAMTFIKLKR